MKDLIFITGNQHKANYLSQWLGTQVAHQKVDLDEIQSLDLMTVARHKAEQAFALVGKPVLVEDAGVTFEGMGRLPGTFTKWFIEELGTAGMAALAQSLPTQQATGRLLYALHDGVQVHFFEGIMKGRISATPQGTGGFGYDTIFINEGYDITRAEMNEDDYAKTSYRAQAIQRLKQFLSAPQ